MYDYVKKSAKLVFRAATNTDRVNLTQINVRWMLNDVHWWHEMPWPYVVNGSIFQLVIVLTLAWTFVKLISWNWQPIYCHVPLIITASVISFTIQENACHIGSRGHIRSMEMRRPFRLASETWNSLISLDFDGWISSAPSLLFLFKLVKCQITSSAEIMKWCILLFSG